MAVALVEQVRYEVEDMLTREITEAFALHRKQIF